MRKIIFATLASTVILSCGNLDHADRRTSAQKEEWSAAEDPSAMDSGRQNKKYTRSFSKLPLSSSLKTVPWSDYYWPNNEGGLSYRWNDEDSKTDRARFDYEFVTQTKLPNFDLTILSPMEKFDIFLGLFDYPHTKAERERSQVFTRKSDSWEGLCESWAAAAFFFKEPSPVTIKGKSGIMVPFGSSDVKALLIYFIKHAEATTRFLGTRCPADLGSLRKSYHNGSISSASYEQQLRECSGLNAGAFHLVLSNEIGIFQEDLVVNKMRTHEVWNQPVYSYSSKVIADVNKKSEGAAPGTVREIEMNTRMNYVEIKGRDWDKNDETGEASKDYHYRLELDKDGNIIGGAWLGKERPGFAWKQTKPDFIGAEFEAIKKIYEAALKAEDDGDDGDDDGDDGDDDGDDGDGKGGKGGKGDGKAGKKKITSPQL